MSVTVGIRAQLQNKHCEESMSGSNIEDVSEQTRGREIESTAWGKGKKDKSRDTFVNMKARLANVDLAMTDIREGLDLIEQGMEKGMKDLRE